MEHHNTKQTISCRPVRTRFHVCLCRLATDIINSLQGLIIFFLLVVFRKRVRRDLANINVIRNRLPREWATIPKEDCEELEEEEEQLSLTDNKNNAI